MNTAPSDFYGYVQRIHQIDTINYKDQKIFCADVSTNTAKMIAVATGRHSIECHELFSQDNVEQKYILATSAVSLFAVSAAGDYIVYVELSLLGDRLKVVHNIHEEASVSHRVLPKEKYTEMHSARITSIKFSKVENTRFFTSSEDATVRMWSVQSIKEKTLIPQRIFKVHDGHSLEWQVKAFALSKNDNLIVAGCEKSVHLFENVAEIRPWPLIDTIPPSSAIKTEDAVQDVYLRLDGIIAYMATTSSLISVKTIGNRTEKHRIPQADTFTRITGFDNDRGIAAISNTHIVLFDNFLNKLRQIPFSIPTTIGWNADRQWLYVGSGEGKLVFYQSQPQGVEDAPHFK